MIVKLNEDKHLDTISKHFVLFTRVKFHLGELLGIKKLPEAMYNSTKNMVCFNQFCKTVWISPYCSTAWPKTWSTASTLVRMYCTTSFSMMLGKISLYFISVV